MVERDKNIIRFLESFRFATSMQLSTIFFRGSLRSTQARLKKLYDRKVINRFERPAKGFNEFVYCLSQKNKQQLEHHLSVTQCYTDLCSLSGNVNFVPHYPVSFVYLGRKWRFIADALITYHKPTGGGRILFLEIERRDYSKRYNKQKHYEAYYVSGAWRQESWSMSGKIFPAIVVVADEDRLSRIKSMTTRSRLLAPWQWVAEGKLVEWMTT